MIGRIEAVLAWRLRYQRIDSFEGWQAYCTRSTGRRRRIERYEAALPTEPVPVIRTGFCHVCDVVTFHRRSVVGHVVVKEVAYGKEEAAGPHPHPPAGQGIVVLADAVVLVVHDGRFWRGARCMREWR